MEEHDDDKGVKSSSSSDITLDDYEDGDEDVMTTDQVTFMEFLDPYAMSTEIRKRFNNTVKKSKDRMAKVQKTVRGSTEDMDIVKMRRRLSFQVDRLQQRLTSEQVVSLGEKITFTVSLLNVFLIGYMIGGMPEKFHYLYTIESALLLPYRFFTYKRKNYHYFLADLCYFANTLMLLYIWVFPESPRLYITCYAFAFGTLSWAVITWRNSLVLHSIEKTTSCFIHLLPPIVFHVITHLIDPKIKAKRFPGAMQESWKMTYGIFWTSIAYVVWQSAYHYFITHRRKDKIKEGSRMTSFEYLRKSYAKTRLGKWVNGLPGPFPVIAFTLIQFSFQIGTMMLCPIWYTNAALSAIFLCFVCSAAAYSGATYYLDIMAKRFQKELIKLQEKVNEADHSEVASNIKDK